MPGKSTAESIQELRVDVAALTERVNHIQDRSNELKTVRERLAVVESLLNESRKREEQTETRRWQVVLLFGGSLLTLPVQIIVLFLKK